MKITAEFNSMDEVLSFVNTFGVKPLSEVGSIAVTVKEIEDKEEKVPVAHEEKAPEDKAADKSAEENSNPVDQEPREEKTEDPKVTKEMVREVFAKLMRAGKQDEAKALTTKYKAKRVPDIKEEDYAAVYREAEALL